MERNKLLKLAATVCRVLSALQLAGIIIASIVLIHWHIDKEFYREVKVNAKGSVNITSRISESEVRENGTVWIEKSQETESTKLTLADLTPASVYFLYVQSVAVMIFVFLIFREFGRIVKSVSALQTFRNENVEAFRRIGKYLLVIFLVSGFHFIGSEPANAHVSISFDTTPLILMLVAYVLAEIFKEGNRLYEEEQLTV